MKNKSYEFLPHTADVKFRAYGKTLNEAFVNAAYALTDVITDHTKVKGVKSKIIKVKSENIEALLYDFLEQFLILLDDREFLLSKIKNLKIDSKGKLLSLAATVIGDIGHEKYDIDTHVKAITYQEMFVNKIKKGYELQVIVDI